MVVVSGLILAFSKNIISLFIASVLGSIGTSGSAGVFSPIEHAILTQSCSDEYRTKAFSYYYLFGSVAGSLGSLFSGFPDVIAGLYGLSMLIAFQILFLFFTGLSFIISLSYLGLSRACELSTSSTPLKVVKISDETKRFVFKLSLLFSVDSFALPYLWVSLGLATAAYNSEKNNNLN